MMIIGNETDKYRLFFYRVEGNDNFHASVQDNATGVLTLLFDNIAPEKFHETAERLANQWFSYMK